MGGVADRPRRAGPTRAGARSVAQRDHHAAACVPQFRLQISQELLSRLRRAAVARLLSRHALLRALRHPAEKATLHLPYDICISLLSNAESIYIQFIVNTM